jgi:phage recombination protein Bet
MTTEIAPAAPSLLAKIASRYSVEPAKMLSTLKATAFRQKEGPEVSNEQMMALLVVADQYGLNPWTKEIYAFPDKHNGIVPVVGVDGWSRIINTHEQFDGIDFVEAETVGGAVPAWVECVIYRKDRSHAIRVKEYFAECKRNTGPWGSHPRRMLRHKAMIQCARLAFGFVGILDDDEAARIVDATAVEEVKPAAAAAKTAAATAAAKATKRLAAPKPAKSPKVEALDGIAAAVAAAGTLDELEEIRKRAYGYHDDGLFGDADLDAAKDYIMKRVEAMTTADGEIIEAAPAAAGNGGDA